MMGVGRAGGIASKEIILLISDLQRLASLLNLKQFLVFKCLHVRQNLNLVKSIFIHDP